MLALTSINKTVKFEVHTVKPPFFTTPKFSQSKHRSWNLFQVIIIK